MLDDNSTPAPDSEKQSEKTPLTPEERAAQWAPEWSTNKSPVNRGSRVFLILSGIVLISILVYLSVGKQPGGSTEFVNLPSSLRNSNQFSPPEGKAVRILREQKAASEDLTRQAVELIKASRMPEVRQLYKKRWNEIATLRTNIVFNKDLSDAEKKNIDNALQIEQEAINDVLAKYEGLYGR
jgi:hypothetical protein